jgi:uncharacterized protein (DUF302 family)
MTTPSLALQTTLSVPYEQAIERITSALKAEGFGVLTEIDVQATLKKKLEADFRKYMILGACNPSLAHRALQTDLDIGLLLPCNVIVYETNSGSTVAAIDPLSMLGIVDNPDLEDVAREARTRLERAIAAL